jgi:hypothetical protein
VAEQIDHYQWEKRTFPWLYIEEVLVAEQRTLTPAYILHGAIAALKWRGRCRRDFETGDGRVCQLGALAVAASFDADVWRFLQDATFEELDQRERVLIAAAQILARVEAPMQPVHEMSLRRLVTLLSDSNDIASDSEVFTFLARAARVAAVRASWLPVWRGAARLAEKAGARS